MSAINIDQNNIQSEVMNSDKPVLLDFWAPWCGPCRMVVPIVEEIARLKHLPPETAEAAILENTRRVFHLSGTENGG